MKESFSFISYLKKTTFQGLLAIFPVSITIAILLFFYKAISRILAPLDRFIVAYIPILTGTEMILGFMFIFLIGIGTHFLLIVPLVHYMERLIGRIPVIKNIYFAAKSFSEFFNNDPTAHHFQKVVLIQYPHAPYYNVAFLLGPAYSYVSSPAIQSLEPMPDHFRVFIPTSPLPGHGFFVILPESEIIETSLSFEEALKITISCGLIDLEHGPFSKV